MKIKKGKKKKRMSLEDTVYNSRPFFALYDKDGNVICTRKFSDSSSDSTEQ